MLAGVWNAHACWLGYFSGTADVVAKNKQCLKHELLYEGQKTSCFSFKEILHRLLMLAYRLLGLSPGFLKLGLSPAPPYCLGDMVPFP